MNQVLGSMKKTLLYAGMSPKDYRLICPDMRKENKRSLMAFSAITCVFLLVMFLLSFFSKDVADSRWVYFIILLAAGLIFFTAKSAPETEEGLMLAAIYTFVSLLFVFGIILGTVTRPDEQTVTFVALLLTVPLLFSDRPIRMVLCIFVFVICFIVTAVFVKEDYVLVADIIDVTVFGSISAIVSTYMMRLKCQRFLFARKVEILSETDLLTGLCNRNSFEQRLGSFRAGGNRQLGCVYVDANGLHELNNTKGHQAGDAMLQFVGRTLQDAFGEKNTFRIGGDEFVALIMEVPDALAEKIDGIHRLIEGQNYHASIGWAMGNTAQTTPDQLVSLAEQRMYEAKRQFYQQKESGRTSRR